MNSICLSDDAKSAIKKIRNFDNSSVNTDRDFLEFSGIELPDEGISPETIRQALQGLLGVSPREMEISPSW
ncbi:MAG: hypothetical protein D6732_17325 [Methanobacteriota archaeon]|nr:MAG: hypothetical protein D6732_17325 [Euryarchaeota archaeon]